MRYGLDCPQVNHPIRDTKSGKILLLDMAYPEFKIAIEYDGRHHANQWLSDSLRREAIEDAGWIYVQVTSSNLNDESKEELLARRVASKIEQRIRTSVPICARMSIEQVADGRHLNRKPLHEKYVDRIALTPPIE